MSFPRAKIQRFNDLKSCAPPPGSYDPKFEPKVKGAVIEKSERFAEGKSQSQSSASAESPANVSLTSSSSKSTNTNWNCLPVFRTPQLPRKHIKPSTAPLVKAKLKFEPATKNGTAKEVDPELYEALLVDRDNKDATIKENETLIDELYERIRNLEKELKDFQNEKEKLGENHVAELKLNDQINQEKLEVQNKELTNLKKELEDTKQSLEELREAHQVLEKSLSEKELLLLSHKQSVEEEVQALKESVAILSDKNSDLDCKLNQKQQMILLLQSELSSAGLELEECRSETEKVVTELIEEKSVLFEKHTEVKNEMKNLEKLLAEEREIRAQEVQSLQENILNSSVVRENLETDISDKESSLRTLKTKHEALEAMYDEACERERKLKEELEQRLEDLKQEYEERMNELKVKACEKEEEIEMRLKALNEKYCSLEAEYEKSCLEHNLVMEAHRLEMDEIRQKCDEEVAEIRVLASEKEKQLEETLQEVIDKSAQEVEDQVTEVRSAAETNLKQVRNILEERLNDHTADTMKKLETFESKMEIKLKETEQKIRQLSEEATRTVEELRKVTHQRDELSISNLEHRLCTVDMQDKIDMLETELNTAKEKYETELNTVQNKYEADLSLARSEENLARNECKKLKIGMNTIKDSLEALRKRLLESETDVERLTQALEEVKTEKAAAEEEVSLLNKELEVAKANVTHLTQNTVHQIEEVRTGLLNMLEDYRKKAEKNVAAKEEEILDYRHKIEELSARIFELTDTLSATEEANAEHEREIEALTEKLDHQRECAQIATQQISSLEASNAIYQHQIQALTAELDYQKGFSHNASEHIAALATVKSNQEREISTLSKELNAERSKVTKLNKDIAELKDGFDRYKEEIRCVIQNYNHELQSKEFEIESKNRDLSQKSSDMKKVTEKMAELVSESESKEVRIEELSSEVEELKQALDTAVQLKLSEKEQYYKSLLEKAEERAALADQWENSCKELEGLIGPFREQLEIFEAERKALEMKKEAAEVEVRELSLKYAEILGHQNHKQKIKYLIKLKEQNLELTKDVERLEAQNRAQKRVIDKMKNEQRSVAARKQVLQHHNPSSSKGKENVENTSVPKSPLQSPNKKSLRTYR